jgi:ribokinase
MIAVLGSLNMDLVLRVAKIPAPGETLLGSAFQMMAGGKGANQAYAAAKLGVPVAMAGKVGYDLFGDRLRAHLAAAGVDVAQVRSVQDAPTGVATIHVSDEGQNAIVVASGANFIWSTGEVESLRPIFRQASHVLFQLETPPAIVEAGLRIAKQEGAVTILDPAPAQALPASVLANVDYLTPNESEAEAIGAVRARNMVYKLGAAGCLYQGMEGEIRVPAPLVQVVDTTAAGDTFNAAFAVALSEKQALPDALRFANHAAALSVTRLGAQASAPTREEVLAFLREQPSAQ